MSAQSYSNPDARPLPDGWITQFDPNYQTWFYVNTKSQRPVSTWDHPLGPAPPPIQIPQYVPPTQSPPPPLPSHPSNPPAYDNVVPSYNSSYGPSSHAGPPQGTCGYNNNHYQQQVPAGYGGSCNANSRSSGGGCNNSGFGGYPGQRYRATHGGDDSLDPIFKATAMADMRTIQASKSIDAMNQI